MSSKGRNLCDFDLVVEWTRDKTVPCPDVSLDLKWADSGSAKMTILMQAIKNHNLQNDNSSLVSRIIDLLGHNNEDINLKNHIGSTALMIAAEEGHLEFVKQLILHNAALDSKNNYGQTAFILAIEKNHISIVQYLVTLKSLFPTQLTHENNYAKSSLFVACEFAKADIVEWLLNECGLSPTTANTRTIFPLMLACAGPMSESRLKVVDLLIAKNPDCVNCVNKANETVLHWAAIQGHWEIIKRVFESRHFNFSLINNISDTKNFGDGKTALLRAVYSGDEECVELLISHGADFQLATVPKNPAEEKPQDAFQMAWLQGFPKIATKFFMLVDPKECNESFRKYSLIKNLDLKITEVFTDAQIQLIAKRLANTNNIFHLQDLVHYAGIYEFHFNLFIDIVFPMFTSPNIALNKTIDFFFSSLQHRNFSHVQLVSHLVRLAAALTTAIEEHPLEQTDLKKRLDTVESMLTECVSCDSMDDRKNIELVMCSDNKEFYENRIVQYSQAFLSGPVRTCLDFHITSIFSTANLSLFIDEIFWSYLKRSDERRYNPFNLSSILLKPIGIPELEESRNIRNLQSNLIHGRYCPAFMLFAEGASKAFFLFLISATSMALYSPGVEGTSPILEVLKLKRAIYVFLFTLFWYEIGQLCNHTTQILPTKKSIAGYFNEVWNYLDMFGIILVMLWIGSRQHYDHTLSGLLPTAAVFYACSLLRYLSVHEELGKLVIMIFAMSADLAVFGIVYLICVAGFTVAIWALFSGVDGLHSFMDVFLFLCSITMGNAPFDAFNGSPYSSIGMTLVFCFLVFTGIILINLVIARMSATHDRINETSFQEWQFDRATTTDSFILIEERHPFCMLPAPLNLLTMAVTPLHWLMIYLNTPIGFDTNNNPQYPFQFLYPCNRQGMNQFSSIAGTTSDLLLGFVMSFVAPFLELLIYNMRLIARGKLFPSQAIPQPNPKMDPQSQSAFIKRKESFLSYFTEFLLINLTFPLVYPFYVYLLMCETVEFRTDLLLTRDGDGSPVYKVQYILKSYVPLPPPKRWEDNEDDLILNIRVLRCSGLNYADTIEITKSEYDSIKQQLASKTPPTTPILISEHQSRDSRSYYKQTPLVNRNIENPVLKLRFGRVEISTPESVNGTKNPNWPNCVLQIPKSEIDKSHGKNVEEVKFIDIAVYDRDQVTGKETLVLEKKQAIDLGLLFSDGRLEGSVPLNLTSPPSSSPSTPSLPNAQLFLAVSVMKKKEVAQQFQDENTRFNVFDTDFDEEAEEEVGFSRSLSHDKKKISKRISTQLHKQDTPDSENPAKMKQIPDESQINQRLRSQMDLIFGYGDIKRIFLLVDTLQDVEFERDYLVCCQRALGLVQQCFKQFLLISAQTAESSSSSSSSSGSHQTLQEIEGPSLSLLLSIEEFLVAFQRALSFLSDPSTVNVSGPFAFQMEKVRLETLLSLTEEKQWEQAFSELRIALQQLKGTNPDHLHFRNNLLQCRNQCKAIYPVALKELRRLLSMPIPDSHVPLSLHSETPITKKLKNKIKKLEASLKIGHSQHSEPNILSSHILHPTHIQEEERGGGSAGRNGGGTVRVEDLPPPSPSASSISILDFLPPSPPDELTTPLRRSSPRFHSSRN